MKKISKEAKRRYDERIKEYKLHIAVINVTCKELDTRIKSKPEEVNYERLKLANENLNLLSYNILMNSLSLSSLGIRNEGFLNEARKCCYKSIISLEEIVTPYVDSPFSDYEEGLLSIHSYSDEERHELVCRLGYSIDSVKQGFGENSKWRWSFVELEGRFAAVTKNLINMKTFIAQLDPRVEGYSKRLAHLNLAQRLLQQTADRYREKYELSSLNLEDMRKALVFLSALKRIHILLGEVEKSEVVKKKIDVWKMKLESDQLRLEQASRKAKVSRASEKKGARK